MSRACAACAGLRRRVRTAHGTETQDQKQRAGRDSPSPHGRRGRLLARPLARDEHTSRDAGGMRCLHAARRTLMRRAAGTSTGGAKHHASAPGQAFPHRSARGPCHASSLLFGAPPGSRPGIPDQLPGKGLVSHTTGGCGNKRKRRSSWAEHVHPVVTEPAAESPHSLPRRRTLCWTDRTIALPPSRVAHLTRPVAFTPLQG